jgi:hypothetical protein
MAGDKIINRLSGTAVRNVIKFDFRDLCEPFADEVLLCTCS